MLETVLERDAYFALVDLIPSAGLPHPFRYVFVDAETGEVTTDHAWYPPLIDGVPTYTTYEERTDPAARFEPADLQDFGPEMEGIFEFEEDPFSGPAAVGAIGSPPALNGQGGSGGQRIAIGVAGGRDSWHTNTVNIFTEKMANAGFETEKYFSKDHKLDDLMDLIRERTADLGEGDKVVLFMHMHAWGNDKNDDGVLDNPSQAFAYDYGGENQRTWSVLKNNEGSMADLLDDIPAESVNVVIQACGAAGTLLNRLPKPLGGAPFQAYPGSTVRVYASSAQNRVSLNTRGIVGPRRSRYMDQVLGHLDDNPLDANGDGTMTLDEIESGFAAGHQAATDAFAAGAGDLFPFDQKPPPVGTFTGGTLQIDAPGDGSVFPFGEQIVFQGQGMDPVKGSLTFLDLTWESDKDGVLGMGNTLPRNDLSQGEHTITLTGTFLGEVTVTRTIKVTIGIGGVPQVSFTSPTGGTYTRGEDTIEFSATASDPEDGALDQAQDIFWTSNIDDDIGTGESLSLEADRLSPGVHTITVEAHDSNGNITRLSFQITVLKGRPKVSISSPVDGMMFTHTQEISFTGSATDPEDGPIPGSQRVWTSSIDGLICTAASCSTSLSPGVHTITQTATDMDGNTGTAEVTVILKFPAGVSLTGTLGPHTGPFIWPPTISNPGPIELVTEVVDGVMFLTIKSDADLRGEYDPQTGEWMATGETIFPGAGTLRETYQGTWEEEDGKMVFRGTLMYEFTPEDGSEPGTATYDVEFHES